MADRWTAPGTLNPVGGGFDSLIGRPLKGSVAML